MGISFRSIARIASLLLLTVFLSACDEEAPEVGPEEEPPKQEDGRTVGGYAQMGPYLAGGTITVSELGADLLPTGRTLKTTIDNNSGVFTWADARPDVAISEFAVEGFYFNWIEGRVSEAPLTLLAISANAKNEPVNINLLTHLERDRVKHLVQQGSSFQAAKAQASQEVGGIFGFTGNHVSERMDISEKSDLNGKLLAISVIIQARRSVAEVSALLAALSTDIKEDGILNNAGIRTDLRTQAMTLPLDEIRKNLYSRYTALGLRVGIPHFERYIYEYTGLGISRGTVRDIDDQEYRTERIGNQWWMVNSLRTTRYANGDSLKYGNYVNGNDLTKYYFFRDANIGTPVVPIDTWRYGNFYTRASVMNGAGETDAVPSGVQGVCPNGWHVPSLAEYQILLDHIESRGYARTLDVVNNEVGFSLGKVGWRGYDLYSWGAMGTDWALATTGGTSVNSSGRKDLNAALNVRCVKD